MQRRPNTRRRAARLAMVSPSGSGLPLSRAELAELVNAHLAARDVGWLCMDAAHIGKYERGEHIWPQREYRQSLRAVLGVDSDADLGFYTRRTVDLGAAASARTSPGRGGVTVAALAMRFDTCAATTPDTTSRVMADIRRAESGRSVDA